MPPKSKKEPTPKELYLFLVEADELKGTSTASNHIVSKLVSDKIFTESEDVICIRRHDELHSLNFDTATWDTLKAFKDVTTIPAKKPAYLVKDLETACESLMVVGEDDEYAAYKILYFGYFNSFKLDENDIINIRTRMETDFITLTIIFPVEENEMSPIQLENFLLLRKILHPSDWCHVYTYKQTLARVLNLKAIKDKRSMPWNVKFEIGASLSINVKKLIVNRKHASEFKNPSDEPISKETIYTLNDGTVVDEESLGDAYLYGGEVVCLPEKDSGSGEEGASLKLLAFCPRENIQPTYMTGDGTDIFFAQDDSESALKFNALVRAMANLDTVAIVRKVWRKNAQVQIGVLAPDLARKGLIYADLCYADDISTPVFADLIKEDGADGINEKDELIDELIRNKSLLEFDPFRGPVDPKVLVQREAITRKILNEYIPPPKKEEIGENGNVEDKKVSGLKGVHNNIELYFEELIKTDPDVIEKIKSTFPLVVNKETGADRPSGKQIFRKRGIKEETNGNEDKRIKLEEEGGGENGETTEAIPQAATCDMDDLLDDL